MHLPRRRRRAILLAAVFLLVLGASLTVMLVRRGSIDRAPARETALREDGLRALAAATRPRPRLVVAGLDGLDWDLLDELMARGEMKNVRALVSRGAQAVMDVPPPLLSPVVWTTIATGMPPEVHGVLDFLETDPADGSVRPVGSRSRNVPALWEMTAAAGRETAVIGWWATFPAEPVPGCTIYSDRLTEQLIGLEAETPGAAAPEEAARTARRLQLRAGEVGPGDLAPLTDVSAAEIDSARERGSSWNDEDPVAGLLKLVAATTTVERLTAHEISRGTEVVFTYLEGTDTVGHLFGAHRPPPMPGVTPAEARRWGDVPDRYYAHVDRWIGELVARIGEDGTIVLVSDHGFTWGDDRPKAASETRAATAEWWHRPEAVFIAAGPHVRPTTSRERLGVLDVAPALLELAGLPPGAGMPGAVPEWLLVPGPVDGPRPVDYARLLPRPVTAAPSLGDAAREEQIAKLRALGYLGGGEAREVTRGGAPGAGRAESRRLNNLGSSQLAAGDADAAERTFRRAIAADPTYAAAHYNLSVVYRKGGHFDDADREFWRSVELGIADRERSIVRLALDYRERGDHGRAERIFREGRERFPASGPIWVNSGVFLGERGRFAEARAVLERAVEIEPESAMAHRNLAAALLRLGERDEARRALTRASRLLPDDEAIRRELARLGRPSRK